MQLQKDLCVFPGLEPGIFHLLGKCANHCDIWEDKDANIEILFDKKPKS